jgi:hypothetical protein
MIFLMRAWDSSSITIGMGSLGKPVVVDQIQVRIMEAAIDNVVEPQAF